MILERRTTQMKKLLLLSTLSLLALAGCKTDPAPANSTAPVVAAPKGVIWSETTSVTPEGGMKMGNPNAQVKLIEYGSLTCGHCAEFSKESHSEIRQLVDKGTVSFEFRTYLLGAQDIAPSLLARCGGAAPFFSIAEQMYEKQSEWTKPMYSLSPDDQKAMQAMQPTQMASFFADKLGLVSFVQARGVPGDKAKACLADTAAIDQLVKITDSGTKEFKITGTPTFVVNGVTVDDLVAGDLWPQLKPKLIAAGG
jgi:protein-disulfide isomerase